jgi:hypothetical protein
MTKQTDIILVSTPVMETRVPAPAIYYLKGALNPHGFSCRCFDLVRDSEDHFGKEDNKRVNSYLLADWHAGMHADVEDKAIYDMLLDYYRDYVLEKFAPLNPKWVGISVFSQNSQKSTYVLCQAVREVLPEAQIVLGGTGLGTTMGGKKEFGSKLINLGLADHFIDGEGEIALVELLKGNFDYPGINSTVYDQIDNLDDLPFPDYSDYMEDYGDIRKITLTGSRGCVRRCSFCDIGAFWKKFRYRSGANIAKEIIRNKELYNSKVHFFSDSLINGSMKAFREFCEVMAEYHEKNPQPKDQIIWGGQFIIRSERQSPAEDYELMKRAGMGWASIGIESASEDVRNHMDKQFSNEDMYFSIDQLIKNGINVTAMFIVGYPTETEEMFQENIKFLEYYADRNAHALESKGLEAQGCLKDINLGQTLGVLADSPLALMTEAFEGNDTWVSKVVPGLDFEERVRRRKVLSEVANRLNYDVRWDEKQLHFLNRKLERWQSKGKPIR